MAFPDGNGTQFYDLLRPHGYACEVDVGRGGVAKTREAEDQDHVFALLGMGDFREDPAALAIAAASTSDTKLPPGLRFSAKIPPLWDGTRSFYEWERDVRDWCGIAHPEPRQRGPALMQRIVGSQLWIREHLDPALVAGGRTVPENKLDTV